MADKLKDIALKLLDTIEPLIRKIVREEIKNCVKAAMATVISADNTNYTAVVTQIYSDTQMTLFNCTGKTLSAGDSVIIMWFGSMTNAWIGIKNDGTAWNT